ncbi:MAG: glycoside hydrolase family 28 protein [Bacteroidaceae bacterium]|nr:glycoside hydrolase family 28 protein [Bacteroidaceae bacterium]
MNKLLLTLLSICLSAATYAAPKDYSYLYKDLPFKMEKVKVASFPNRSVNLWDLNIKGDGKTMHTAKIQKAIDDLSKKGGGKLVVPSGTWLTGPLNLKSNVNLCINKGAILLFSPDVKDYPLVKTTYEGQPAERHQSPITADNCTNIAITGQGIIDGNGQSWRPLKREKVTDSQWKRLTGNGGSFRRPDLWAPAEKDYARPVMVHLIKCKKVLLEGVVFQNSPAWNIHPELCEDFIMDGVEVRNPSYAQNGDGLDLESCRNCLIVNSSFDVGDDGICLKSGKDEAGRKRGKATENVIIDGCTVYASHGGFVIGSEMSGGVRNIKCANSQFSGTDIGLRFKSCRGRGGVVENIWVENIAMINILADAIRFNLYYGGKSAVEELADGTKRPAKIASEPLSEKTPSFRDIHIKNITCNGALRALYFNGLPEMPVKKITLDDVHIKSDEPGELIYCEDIKMKRVTIDAKNGKNLPEYYCKNISKK